MSKAKSKQPVLFVEDDDSISEDDNNNTPRGNANRPSVLDLRPNDINYTPLTEEEMKTTDDSELKARAGALPKLYDIIPESVWIALTTGEKGLKDADDKLNLRKVWEYNMEQFQQCHAESLNIVKRIYPNLCAATGGVRKLDYGVMKKRFSQDGPNGTRAGVDKTLVERMYGILVKHLTSAQKHYLVEDGDLIVADANTIDPDDSDTEGKADATQSSKTRTTSGRKRKRAAGAGESQNSSNMDNKESKTVGETPEPNTDTVASSDIGNDLRLESSKLVDLVYDVVNREYGNAEEAKTRIEDLLDAQATISEAVVIHINQLHENAEQAKTSVESLRVFYDARNAERQELINSYTRVIDILYDSYIRMFTLLHSSNIWFGTPVTGDYEEYEQRLDSIARHLHPKPLQPLRGSTSLQFKDTADVVRDITIFTPHEVKNELKRETRVRESIVSVLRFSSGLQAELDAMNRIPPDGMINVSELQDLPYPTVKRITEECKILRSVGPPLIQVNDPSNLEAIAESYQQYLKMVDDDSWDNVHSTASSSTDPNVDGTRIDDGGSTSSGGSHIISQTDGSNNGASNGNGNCNGSQGDAAGVNSGVQ